MEVAIKDIPCAALELEFSALGKEVSACIAHVPQIAYKPVTCIACVPCLCIVYVSVTLALQFQDIAVRFCFDPLMFSFDRTPMEEFFNSMLDLADMYEKAADKVQQQNRLEEMKARRLAARETKLQKAAIKSKRGTHSSENVNFMEDGKGGKGQNEVGKEGSNTNPSAGTGGKAAPSKASPGRGKGSNTTSGKGGKVASGPKKQVSSRFAAMQSQMGAMLRMDD